MDCGRCGSWLESPHPGDVFFDEEAITCPECQTVNQIGVEPGAYEEEGYAYVALWTCKHGKDDATPCPECDAEDAAPRSPPATPNHEAKGPNDG